MTSQRTIHCPSCGTGYSLSGSLVTGLAGKSVTCASCEGTWVPFPATGFLARLRAPKPAPIDLLPYRQTKEEPLGAPAASRELPPPERTVPIERAEPAAPAPDDFAFAPERPLVPDVRAAMGGGGPVEGTVLNLVAPGRGMQSAGSPLSGLQVGFVGLEGRFAGKSFRVTKTPTLIGRTTGDILLPDNQVSGRHAQLDVLGAGHCSLKDLASTNGTTVNGRPISTASVKNGDVISFGGLQFRFVVRLAEKRPGAE